jgi:hypothetical protein
VRSADSAALFGGVGEHLDQVLVRLAEDVGLGGPVADVDAGEVIDQVAQQRIRKSLFIGPLRVVGFAFSMPRIAICRACPAMVATSRTSRQ